MSGDRAQSATMKLEALCAEDLDYASLQLQSAEVIRAVVPFNVGVQATVDPASMIDTSCVMLGLETDLNREQRLFELEYGGEDPLTYREIALRPERAAALRMEVDDPRQVQRFVEIIEPGGGIDELRAMFVADRLCWGSMTVYRTQELPLFSPADVRFFTSISATMARGLRRAFLRAAVADPGRLEGPPGHLLMDTSLRLLSTTDAAQRWLATLDTGDRMPTVLMTLLAQIQRGTPIAQATVVGTAGPVTMHASPIKGMRDVVTIIIEQPRPVHLASLIIGAYGLTERERQVAEGVLQGRLTKEVARDLGISDYTVQDHLKSIFAKMGVGTRGELAHALYARHYLPLTLERRTPGPYGYYIGAAEA